MKVGIIGSRGLPARYGGFETFVEKLAPALAKKGMEITVVNEKGNGGIGLFSGNVRVIESSFSKKLHPVAFYFDSIRRVANDCDIVIVCGVGGALFYPFFKFGKTKWITNVDGLEHLRGKYSMLKKFYVRLAQLCTLNYSDMIIADSEEINNFWVTRMNAPIYKIRTIAYGVDVPGNPHPELLHKLNLKTASYYLAISRLVPENNSRLLIESFIASRTKRKMVFVGDTSDSLYASVIATEFKDRVIFTKSIFEKEILDALRQGAFGYLHGHSVGGTNPSLLEAMAAGCVCICHDNPFNREVAGSSQLYFSDKEALISRIREVEKFDGDTIVRLKNGSAERAKNQYSWEEVFNNYEKLLNSINA